MWSEAIAAVIAEAQEAGTVAYRGDPQALGRFVLNAWQGTLLRAKTQRGEEPFRDFVAVVYGALLAPAN